MLRRAVAGSGITLSLNETSKAPLNGCEPLENSAPSLMPLALVSAERKAT